MKKCRFIILLIVVLFMSGCVKQKVDMTITDGNKMKIEITSAMSSSASEYSKDDPIVKNKEELESLGFKVRDYIPSSGEDMKGIVISKTYNLNKISSDQPVVVHLESIGNKDFDDSKYFQITKKGLFSDTYKATFIFDTSGESEDIVNYADSFDISYSLTLPRKAITNNADSVDNNVYTWKVKYGEKKEINYEFKVVNTTLIYGLIAVTLIIIISIIIVVVRKKRSNNQQLPNVELSS